MMKSEEKYMRMNLNERIQHFFLLISFIVLVLTGFGLKFPEAWWVRWIVSIIGENAFEARGIVHRVASVVLVLVSFYHLYYILFVKEGKKLVRDFLPRRSDLTEFKNSMFWLVAKSMDRPRFGRFSYIEIMEYWAVVWGTVIMGVTGFVLWFKDFFFQYVSNTGMDIAATIHYYEAILASLAILVWHFYYVFLNPDVAPMNNVWISGTLTKEEMEKEHPLELEELGSEKEETTEHLPEKESTLNESVESESINELNDQQNEINEEVKLNETLDAPEKMVKYYISGSDENTDGKNEYEPGENNIRN